MKTRKSLRRLLLTAALAAAVPMVWTVPVHAQGAPQGSPQMLPGKGMPHEVEGRIKGLDPYRRMLTLEDGTQLTIPPSVRLPEDVKEGTIVKASFEERAGQKVVTSLEVQQK
jgi:hypothetical protein